jgi:hypothetical protein
MSIFIATMVAKLAAIDLAFDHPGRVPQHWEQ